MVQVPGLTFDNQYAMLPAALYERVDPTPVHAPSMVLWNFSLASELGIAIHTLDDSSVAALFSGSQLPTGAYPIAQAYAGHQFGHFTMLGDGRAHLLGEHKTKDGTHFDLQLKGSGTTPFSRRGDGRAALGPMLREYLVSEAMHALGVPTTRSLAVVRTGEIVARERDEPGAVLTRVARSHVRVGTFEYASRRDPALVTPLVQFCLRRHYPQLKEEHSPAQALLRAVVSSQATLIAEWLRIGFVHGVMNTDNMSIGGETIDYGPCAFIDAYDPGKTFSSIDTQGRYAFLRQPLVAQWNLARFAETLLPLLAKEETAAIEIANAEIQRFGEHFQAAWQHMMRGKLGLLSESPEDAALFSELFQWMHAEGADYTNTFLELDPELVPNQDRYQSSTFRGWHQKWQSLLNRSSHSRADSIALMERSNPAVIPRNHLVEEALQGACEQNELAPLKQLLEVLSKPYLRPSIPEYYRTPPTPEQEVHATFCGT